MKIIILTESGNEIGFGHYRRCYSLHENFLKYNFKSLIYLDVQGEFNIPEKHGIVISNWLVKYKSTLKNITKETLVIIDSYRAEKEIYDYYSKNDRKVIVMDDYNRINYGNVELIINPNPYFNENTYKNQICKKIYGGEKFIILSRHYADHKFNSHSKELNQICITVGGSDYKSILPTILKKLKEINNFKLVVIVGNKDQYNKLKFKNIDILYNLSSKSIYDLFNQSCLVISGCGQTLHELSSIRKKTIGILYDKDQYLNQQFYLKRKFLKHDIKVNDLSKLKEIVEYELKSKRKIKDSIKSSGFNAYNELIMDIT